MLPQRIACSLLLLSSMLAAQQVTLHGKVEDLPGVPNQFVVDCTNTTLSSGSLNLTPFVGQSVSLSGAWNGSATSPAVAVTAIQVIAKEFEIGGNGKLGKPLKLGATAPAGTNVVFGLSTTNGFSDLGLSGVAFLDLDTLILVPGGVIPPIGTLEVSLLVPNSPALIGVEVFGQAALISGGGLTLSNPDCKTIQA